MLAPRLIKKIMPLLAVMASALSPSACGEAERIPTVPAGAATAANTTPDSVVVMRVFSNLAFRQPVFLTWVPGGDDRLALVEQAGRIAIFANREDVRQTATFLDISSKVSAGGEEGMLGLAFDPAYQSNGYFYVYYSAASPRRSVISRFTVSHTDPNKADPASEQVIMEITQPRDFSNHKAGMLAFGPDGKLYIGTGDGGGSGDPDGNAQNRGSLLGKILRIDPNAGDPYALPPDNPFVNDKSAQGEIWAYGFRNPYRFSFDRATGDLWAGDVGESAREEVDLVVKGGNYGWNLFEGNQEFKNPDGRPAADFQPPVIDYGRAEGQSIIGGYVYRGTAGLESLREAYLYGDYYTASVWALIYRDGQIVYNREVGKVAAISSFAEGRNGELYVLSHSRGEIYQLR